MGSRNYDFSYYFTRFWPLFAYGVRLLQMLGAVFLGAEQPQYGHNQTLRIPK